MDPSSVVTVAAWHAFKRRWRNIVAIRAYMMFLFILIFFGMKLWDDCSILWVSTDDNVSAFCVWYKIVVTFQHNRYYHRMSINCTPGFRFFPEIQYYFMNFRYFLLFRCVYVCVSVCLCCSQERTEQYYYLRESVADTWPILWGGLDLDKIGKSARTVHLVRVAIGSLAWFKHDTCMGEEDWLPPCTSFLFLSFSLSLSLSLSLFSLLSSFLFLFSLFIHQCRFM